MPDADVFDGPYPGVYPPGTYAGICIAESCSDNSLYDPGSGWCCGGKWKDQQCVCGSELGCQPPAVCCAL